MLDTQLRGGVVVNPGTGEPVGEVRITALSEIDDVLTRAAEAQRSWAATPRHARYAILTKLGREIEAQKLDLATLLSREAGKPLVQAEFEVDTAARLFTGFGERLMALSEEAHFLDSQPGLEGDLLLTVREPLGVVVAIAPFNFPVELFTQKVAPALAMGNAVVAKPSPETPLTIVRLVEMARELGLPPEVLQVVHGDAEVGSALVQHPGVAAVAFTGSTEAGVHIATNGAKTLKKVMLELGGNDALIILPDADLDLAVREAVAGRTLANGQVCCANKRILAPSNLVGDITERLAAGMAQQVVGDQLASSTDVGPLIKESAAVTVESQVSDTVAAGARVVVGGRRDGTFYVPTVLDQIRPDMAVACDMEIFGPVLAVLSYESTEEAIGIANQSRYGLGASVFSTNMVAATGVARQLHSGHVVINGSGQYRPDVAPFGGVKFSGSAREGLSTSLEEYASPRTIAFRQIFS